VKTITEITEIARESPVLLRKIFAIAAIKMPITAIIMNEPIAVRSFFVVY
jgi:hypothetical protein